MEWEIGSSTGGSSPALDEQGTGAQRAIVMKEVRNNVHQSETVASLCSIVIKASWNRSQDSNGWRKKAARISVGSCLGSQPGATQWHPGRWKACSQQGCADHCLNNSTMQPQSWCFYGPILWAESRIRVHRCFSFVISTKNRSKLFANICNTHCCWLGPDFALSIVQSPTRSWLRG